MNFLQVIVTIILLHLRGKECTEQSKAELSLLTLGAHCRTACALTQGFFQRKKLKVKKKKESFPQSSNVVSSPDGLGVLRSS